MDWIKVSQAAKILGVTERFVYKLIDKGELATQKTQGAIKLSKVDVLLSKPTTMTFFNQKGGVSKTTSVAIFADYLEQQGIKTLLVDLDPQSSLSQIFFPYEAISEEKTLTHYFQGKNVSLNSVVRHYSECIDLLPSDIAMASLEFMDTTVLIQRKIQDFYPLFKKYSVILIDCPPALNVFSRFGIALAQYVFIPLILERQCYDGLSNALDTIAQLALINKDFVDYYAFGSRKSGRRIVLHESYLDIYRQQLTTHMLDNLMPDFIGLAERADSGKNFFQSRYDQAQVQKVQTLCQEIFHTIFTERIL